MPIPSAAALRTAYADGEKNPAPGRIFRGRIVLSGRRVYNHGYDRKERVL